jgi:hypothetical protein
MRSHAWLIGIVVAMGCSRAVPHVDSVPGPSGHSVRSVDEDVRGLLDAVLTFFEPDTANVIAGRDLDSDAKAALRLLRRGVIEQSHGVDRPAIPAKTMVIDAVERSADEAIVRLIIGPVPAKISWICGRAMTVHLQRKIVWRVLEEWFPMRCAQQGPTDLLPERASLLEAARLAFSQIRLDPGVQVASDPLLSSVALAVLGLVHDVPPRKQFETDAVIVPANVIVVRTLEQRGDIVEFVGTLGPVPRHATLACGTTWNLRLRQQRDSWVFQNFSVTMC